MRCDTARCDCGGASSAVVLGGGVSLWCWVVLVVAGPSSVVVGVRRRPHYLWWVGISKQGGGAYRCHPRHLHYLSWVGISKREGKGKKGGRGIPSSSALPGCYEHG